MRAAVYCRVSTEDQEREGTSLQSQLDACMKKAKELGFEVSQDRALLETYSGLSLQRPKLALLREWVESKEIEAVIIYTLDRLSRDPVHTVVLEDQLERKRVQLISVTETVDSSDLGKLVSYIKGYAAKLEAEKIRERTIRGRRTRALQGKLPSGSHARLYGYYYVTGKGVGEGIRCTNESEAKWVEQIYRWLVEDGLSLRAITLRLRALGVPTPQGATLWSTSAVHYILSNPAYCGKTYAFTYSYVELEKPRKLDRKRTKTHIVWKPKDEWVEIPNATPAIISEEMFEAAQARLRRNKELSSRNAKRQYLLSGHIYCSRCGRRYWGNVRSKKRAGGRYLKQIYNCSGRFKMVTPVSCHNRNYKADYIEKLVWEKVEALLSQPELVVAELERRQEETKNTDFINRELEAINVRLNNVRNREQRLIRAFSFGLEEELVRREKAMLDKERNALEEEKAKLERRLEGATEFALNVEGIKKFCELVRRNLSEFSFEDKRLTLEALQLKVYVDGCSLSIEGAVPIIKDDVVSSLSRWACPHPTAWR